MLHRRRQHGGHGRRHMMCHAAAHHQAFRWRPCDCRSAVQRLRMAWSTIAASGCVSVAPVWASWRGRRRDAVAGGVAGCRATTVCAWCSAPVGGAPRRRVLEHRCAGVVPLVVGCVVRHSSHMCAGRHYITRRSHGVHVGHGQRCVQEGAAHTHKGAHACMAGVLTNRGCAAVVGEQHG